MVLTTIEGVPYKHIYDPRPGDPMRVVFFASGEGGNLAAVLRLAKAYPELVQVKLLVTDRSKIEAIDVAQEYNIPVITEDGFAFCGKWSEGKLSSEGIEWYRKRSIDFHNLLLEQIIAFENQAGFKFDLAILTYHRWIHGGLLVYFKDRMINQHAGDTTVMWEDNPLQRKYVGLGAVLKALQAGEIRTRTSTIIVREGHDAGETLCQGPWVMFNGREITPATAWEHELLQEQVSDWSSLQFATYAIARGEFGLALEHRHPDGCHVVVYQNRLLPYGGVQLDAPFFH